MDKIRALIKNELDTIDKAFSSIISIDNEILKNIHEFITGNSKRIRSILSLLYIKSYSCDLDENLINIILAGELIHNASLFHDDIIDNAKYRRNNETFLYKYNSNIAVLSGDLLLIKAVFKLLNVNNEKFLDLFLKCTNRMIEAEIIQYLNRGKNISENEYINIASGKTASLFSVILECIALYLNKDRILAKKLGDQFGIIFQITNDLQNESIYNDKENNVKTLINILGIEKTLSFKDNYVCNYKTALKNLPENKYRDGLEKLVDLL